MVFDVCPETLLDLNKRLCPLAHAISHLAKKNRPCAYSISPCCQNFRVHSKENQVQRRAFLLFCRASRVNEKAIVIFGCGLDMGDAQRCGEKVDPNLFKPSDKINKNNNFYNHTILNPIKFVPAQSQVFLSGGYVNKAIYCLPNKISNARNLHASICAPGRFSPHDQMRLPPMILDSRF